MNLFTHKCPGHNVVLRELEPCPRCVEAARGQALAAAGPKQVVFVQHRDSGRRVTFSSEFKATAVRITKAEYKPIKINAAVFLEPLTKAANKYVDFIKQCEEAIARELMNEMRRMLKGQG